MNGTSLVGDSITTVDFNYAGCGNTNPWCTPPPAASSATSGTFQVGFGSTGSFSSLVGMNGLVHSFDIGAFPPGTFVSPGMPNFILIPQISPTISFTLREVFKGSFGSGACLAAPAAGQTCTPVLPGGVVSPLELSNSTGDPTQGDHTGLNAHAQFSVLVNAINIATGEVSQGTGTFSTDFAGYSYQTLLQHALNGDVITTGYHGDFTVTFQAVPEPGTTFAVAGGLLLLVGLSRRFTGKLSR